MYQNDSDGNKQNDGRHNMSTEMSGEKLFQK